MSVQEDPEWQVGIVLMWLTHHPLLFRLKMAPGLVVRSFYQRHLTEALKLSPSPSDLICFPNCIAGLPIWPVLHSG